MAASTLAYRKASLFRRLFIDPVPVSRRAGMLERALYSALFGGGVVVLYTALMLTPNPSGFGTHERLGFGQCSMIHFLNVPCPFCGMTTCFTYMVRLDFINAARANPFGVFFFSAFIITMPILLYGAVFGYKVAVLTASKRFNLYLDVFFAVLALSYSYKILVFIQLVPRP